MAEACIFIMENIDFKDLTAQVKISGEIRNTHINIGTGTGISIEQLADTIKSTIGFKGKLFFNHSKPDGTMKKITDTSKINKLGWQHSIEVEEGINKLYDWYRNLS